MIRELQPQVSLFLCTVNWYKVVDPKPFFTDLGDHAPSLRPALMQHVAPESGPAVVRGGVRRRPASSRSPLSVRLAWAPRNWRQW